MEAEAGPPSKAEEKIAEDRASSTSPNLSEDSIKISPASAAVKKRFSGPVALLVNFFRRLGTLLFTSVKEFLKDECQNLAAQISYFALFSIFPLILVIVVIASLFLPADEVARERLIAQFTGAFPTNTIDVAAIVREAFKQLSRGQPLFIAFSILTLLWSGTGIFDSITNSLNKAWQTPGVKPRSIFESLFIRFILFLIFGLMLIGSIVVTLIYDAVENFARNNEQLKFFLDHNFIWNFFSFLIPWSLTFVTFTLIYQVVPQRKVTFKDVWPGALLATVLFEVVKIGFTFYIARFTNFSLAYGAIAGVIILLFWLYVIAVVLLLGGEMTSVWAEMRGQKRPSKLARQGKADEAPTPIAVIPPAAIPEKDQVKAD
jgi:membrane protein